MRKYQHICHPQHNADGRRSVLKQLKHPFACTRLKTNFLCFRSVSLVLVAFHQPASHSRTTAHGTPRARLVSPPHFTNRFTRCTVENSWWDDNVIKKFKCPSILRCFLLVLFCGVSFRLLSKRMILTLIFEGKWDILNWSKFFNSVSLGKELRSS